MSIVDHNIIQDQIVLCQGVVGVRLLVNSSRIGREIPEPKVNHWSAQVDGQIYGLLLNQMSMGKSKAKRGVYLHQELVFHLIPIKGGLY